MELQTSNSQIKKSFGYSSVVERNTAIATLIVFVLWPEVDCTRIAIDLYSTGAVNCKLITVL